MRNPDRIDVFLEKVDWRYLWKRWGLIELVTLDILPNTMQRVIDYWKENPDQRIGQVLINLNLISDKFDIWSDEESDILIAQGIPPEEVLYWTSYYDEWLSPLGQPLTRLICKLDATHIVNIIKFCFKHGKILTEDYITAFSNMLLKSNTSSEPFDAIVNWWKEKDRITKSLEAWEAADKTKLIIEKHG